MMKIVICIIFYLTVVAGVQAKEWRGIVPMHSTRADVERVLYKPPPKKNYRDAVVYELENEDVLVRYSSDKCKEDWNVPPDTVIYIHVSPKQKLKFSDLKLDVSKYQKRPDPELPEHSYYGNEEEGFVVSVTGEGLVDTFIYSWTTKDIHLRCPEPAMPDKTPDVDSEIAGFIYKKFVCLISLISPPKLVKRIDER
jgi:hypothetical protein